MTGFSSMRRIVNAPATSPILLSNIRRRRSPDTTESHSRKAFCPRSSYTRLCGCLCAPRPARLPHTAGLAACEHRTFSAQRAIGCRAVAVGFLGHQALIELSRANSPPSLSRRSFGCVPFSQQVCQTERLIFPKYV